MRRQQHKDLFESMDPNRLTEGAPAAEIQARILARAKQGEFDLSDYPRSGRDIAITHYNAIHNAAQQLKTAGKIDFDGSKVKFLKESIPMDARKNPQSTGIATESGEEYFIKSIVMKDGRTLKLVRLGKGLNAKVRAYVDGKSIGDFSGVKSAEAAAEAKNESTDSDKETAAFYKKLLHARNSPTKLRDLGYTQGQVDRMTSMMGSGASKEDVLYSLSKGYIKEFNEADGEHSDVCNCKKCVPDDKIVVKTKVAETTMEQDEQRVLDYFKSQGFTSHSDEADLEKELGLNYGRASVIIRSLAAKGLITKNPHGHNTYAVNEARTPEEWERLKSRVDRARVVAHQAEVERHLRRFRAIKNAPHVHEAVPISVSGTGKNFPAMKLASREQFLKAIAGKTSTDDGIHTDVGATEGSAYWKGDKLLGVSVELLGGRPVEYWVPKDTKTESTGLSHGTCDQCGNEDEELLNGKCGDCTKNNAQKSESTEFHSADHPRAGDGKFASSGGSTRSVPSASADRATFKSHKFSSGDAWESPEGKKKVLDVKDGKAVVQTGDNKFVSLVPLDQLGDDVYRDVKNNASRAKAKADTATAAKKDADAISLGGYEKSLEPKELGTARKSLNRTVQSGGKALKLKDLISQKVKDGFKVRGDKLEHPDGRYLDKKVVGTHGLRYANSLSESAQGSVSPEAYTKAEKQKYYSGYEVGRHQKGLGRPGRPDKVSGTNPHWAQGFEDAWTGLPSKVNSPLEFLEGCRDKENEWDVMRRECNAIVAAEEDAILKLRTKKQF